MTIDPSAAGRVYPTQRYEVGREKIREFAEAIGDRDPENLSSSSLRTDRPGEVIAPPTFAMIPVLRGFDLLMDDLGIVFSRVIHGHQRFAYTRPIRAGDRLSATTTLDSIRSRAGNDILNIRCDVAADDGEHVCTATATLVVRTQLDGTPADRETGGGNE